MPHRFDPDDRRDRLSGPPADHSRPRARPSGPRLRATGVGGACPAGAEIVGGDPFSAGQLAAAFARDTLVHLIGTPRPSPAKAQQFLDVDLASIRAAATPRSAHRTHRLRERGASGADDACVHRGARAGRSAGARDRHSGNDSSALVRAGARSLVAVCAAAVLLAL